MDTSDDQPTAAPPGGPTAALDPTPDPGTGAPAVAGGPDLAAAGATTTATAIHTTPAADTISSSPTTTDPTPHVAPPDGPTQVHVPAPDDGAVPPDAPAEVVRARPRRRRRVLRWSVAVPLALLVALVAAWAIDDAVAGDDVARNTELAGTPVGGMDDAELTAAVDGLAATLPDTPITIDTADLSLETTAGALGLSIDTEATAEDVARVGHEGSILERPFQWLGSFATPRVADVTLSVDEAKLDATLAEIEGDARRAPTEPTFAESDGAIVLVPGQDGVRLDAGPVLAGLPRSLGDVSEPIVVRAERTVVPPANADSTVEPLVALANAVLARSVEVDAGADDFTIEGSGLIGGFTLGGTPDAPTLGISDAVLGQQVAAKVAKNTNPTGVRFDIGANGPVPVAGTDAQVCCGEGASQAIIDALLAGEESVSVPTRTLTAAEGVQWASTLGVTSVVGEFTTPHPCCQPRVQNIHRMADTLRGTLIPPGATFSVNDTVGRRTADKGYVSAPVIVDGKHEQDIGGGVSQFATTLFNAAFFGGYDIPEYQMHSEYISRYPYGREATLFYPSVDLKIRNNSPYGVVIWPTYTGSSITVQLWSTQYAVGAQTAQSPTSGCDTGVTTERTRTFPDGSTQKDTFRTRYRCT